MTDRRAHATFVNRMTAPLQRRVRNMIGRCILDLLDDSGGRQSVQVNLYGGMQTLSGVERFQPYGHNAVPPAGSEGIFAQLSGSPDHVVILVMENRAARPTNWEEGESGLYTDLQQVIRLGRAGIEIDGKGLPMTIVNTPSLALDGELRVKGNVFAGYGTGDQVGVQTHTHDGSPPPTPGT